LLRPLLCSYVGSPEEGDRAVSRRRGGVDRARPDPGADGRTGGAVRVRHRHPHPQGEGGGRRAARDPQQRRRSSLPPGEPPRCQG